MRWDSVSGRRTNFLLNILRLGEAHFSRVPARVRKMIKGSCLCGAIEFQINGRVSQIGQCHCSMCRKSTGTAHATSLLASAKNFRWLSGEDNVSTHTNSLGYDTAFCSQCGSPLPKDRGKVFVVPAGSLDTDPDVKPAFHSFVGSKAAWDEIRDDLPQHICRPPDFDFRNGQG